MGLDDVVAAPVKALWLDCQLGLTAGDNAVFSSATKMPFQYSTGLITMEIVVG